MKIMKSMKTSQAAKTTCCQGLKILFTNRAFICCTLLYLFGLLGTNLTQANLKLYCKYVLGDQELVLYNKMLQMIGASFLVFLPMWSVLAPKFGKQQVSKRRQNTADMSNELKSTKVDDWLKTHTQLRTALPSSKASVGMGL